MGLKLATMVSIHWAHLPGREFKVLMRMALTALDKPNAKGQPAHVYFAGWEALAVALNRELPEDDGTTENTRIRKNLCDEISKVTASLVRAGALKAPVDKARREHRQSYQLTIY